METVLKLEYSFDMEDLREYLKEIECEDTTDALKQGIIDYFENECGIPVTEADNFEKILAKLIDNCF